VPPSRALPKSLADALPARVRGLLSRTLIVISTPEEFEPRSDGSPNWLEREIHTFWERFRDSSRIVLVLGPGAPDDRVPGLLDTISATWDWVDLRAFVPWTLPLTGRAEQLDNGFAKIIATIYNIPARLRPILRREERCRRLRQTRLIIVSCCS
jgi:hypothetical protein